MRLLFVDDDPENVEALARVLRAAFADAAGIGKMGPSEIVVATTVEEAVATLHRPDAAGREGFDIVITDLFIPLGERPRHVLGPRSRKYTEDIEHLGGLVLLDEIDRLSSPPVVLAHTACTDPILVQLLGERVHARVPKPAPFEVLLNAILDVIREQERTNEWG